MTASPALQDVPLDTPVSAAAGALAAVVLVPYIALVLAHFYDDLTTPP